MDGFFDYDKSLFFDKIPQFLFFLEAPPTKFSLISPLASWTKRVALLI